MLSCQWIRSRAFEGCLLERDEMLTENEVAATRVSELNIGRSKKWDMGISVSC